jgi:FkbM family methyltransferase
MPVANVLSVARSWMSGVWALLRSGDIQGTLTLVGRTILRSRKPLCIRIQSVPISVRPCTPDLAVARNCLAGEFDAAIAAARPLKHNFIIDAGGYIGTAAMVLAAAFPQATIVSLEPSRENFRILAMNVSAFPNVIPLNVALGSREGAAQLVDRGTGEVGFSTVQAPADCASPSRLHDISVTTVPDLMKRFHASGIDFLKLDIGRRRARPAEVVAFLGPRHPHPRTPKKASRRSARSASRHGRVSRPSWTRSPSKRSKNNGSPRRRPGPF